MPEHDLSGIFNYKRHICGGAGVTFIATAGHCKSGLAVMAGATGLAVFHVPHRKARTARSPDKNRTMAILTFEHPQMRRMTEAGIKRPERNVFYILVAFLTVFFYGKSIFTVMACTA